MTQQDHLVIATRESPLALWQAKYVQSCLKEKFPELDVQRLGLTTNGDKILDVTLFKIEGRARGPEYVRTVVECYKEAICSYR